VLSVERSAIVVGAGLSGLAAAWRLQQSGFTVTVLEERSHPGGFAQTVGRRGYLVDIGPDAMTSTYQRYTALLADFGLTDQLVSCSPVVGVVRDGRIIDVEPKRPLSLLANPVLSVGGKLRLLRGAWKLRNDVAAIDDAYRLVDAADLDDPGSDSLRYSLDRFGSEATAYVIDPVVRLTTGSGAHRASALSVPMAAANDWTAELINVRGGMCRLPYAMAERLNIAYETRALEVQELEDRVVVTQDRGQSEADVCVITAMYHVARRIWKPLDEFAPGYFAALENVKLIAVSIGYDTRAKTKAYTILVPTCEHRDAQLLFMQQNKAPDRAPAGHTLVTMYTDSDSTDAFLERSDDELADWGARVAESFCPELAGHRDMAIVSRWPMTAYLPTPGFWRRTRQLRDAIPPDSRVQLGGALFGAGGMEAAIRWGEHAAERLRHRAPQPGRRPAGAL
jgi:protoporphyrinogen/coproporphyrinogen III oxidase